VPAGACSETPYGREKVNNTLIVTSFLSLLLYTPPALLCLSASQGRLIIYAWLVKRKKPVLAGFSLLFTE